ncbi:MULTISPECIES: flagellar hook-basal body complex protein FliE [Aliagarivorans]|uniref:flagellar hook-basal body complex protein FliE n=1 Tax=Aliagarivorans TaxID=882379 RepID=UPI00040A104F|nr:MULTISPECIES: flagellar hook-basal body complex protein FliE [Aliagarivorans]
MQIKQNQLFSELQAMGQELRNVAPSQDLPGLGQGQDLQVNRSHETFGNLLRDAINNVNNLQGQANDLRTRFDMGDRSVSIGDVMVAAQKSSVAFEATVQVRNKAMEAFKEIMSMPV